MKVTIIENEKTLITKIKAFGKAEVSRDELLHSLAVSCLIYADKTCNVTPASELIKQLSQTTRSNALKAWFIAYGRFNWNAEKEAFGFAKGKHSDVESAKEIPFWKFQKEPNFKTISSESLIRSVINAMEKRLATIEQTQDEEEQQELVDKTKIDKTHLETLRKLIAA